MLDRNNPKVELVLQKWAWRQCRSKSEMCRAKRIPFNLTPDWYADSFEKGCAVTSLPFQVTKGRQNTRSPSVDRIDPTGGYLKENCRMVLAAVNMLKYTGTDEEMMTIASSITARSQICDHK